MYRELHFQSRSFFNSLLPIPVTVFPLVLLSACRYCQYSYFDLGFVLTWLAAKRERLVLHTECCQAELPTRFRRSMTNCRMENRELPTLGQAARVCRGRDRERERGRAAKETSKLPKQTNDLFPRKFMPMRMLEEKVRERDSGRSGHFRNNVCLRSPLFICPWERRYVPQDRACPGTLLE